MKEFKGTPGPWVASKSDRSIGPIRKDDDQSYGMILPIAWVEFDGKPGHHQANANLIAAAPELLESLQAVMSMFPVIEDDGTTRLGFTVETIKKLNSARAAISKALGEQP